MATTTNYGWTTPDDTALVKDGASAIRSLGSSIDTTLKAQIDAQIPDSIIDAKGDLIAGTADNTPAKLSSSGVNGDVLTVDTSTATGLKWATPTSGGMTLISTTTFNGTPTTVLSSIPQTYNDLRIVIRQALPATDGVELGMRFNNDSTANRHRIYTSSTASSALTFSADYIRLSASVDNAVTQSLNIVDIFDYTNTSTWKMCQFNSINNDQTTTTSFWAYIGLGLYNQTSAISSLGFLFNGSNATSGTILLYGVK